MESARAYCKRMQGDLVTINSEAENVFLWKLVQLVSKDIELDYFTQKP